MENSGKLEMSRDAMRFQKGPRAKSLGLSKEGSLLKRFALAFILMSLIPIVLGIYMAFFTTAATIQERVVEIRPVVIWILISAMAGYFVIRGTIRTINLLTSHTKAIANGDLSKHIEIGDPSEVGELARSFNRITADLERKIHELEASRELLQNIFHRIGDAVTSARGIVSLLELVLKSMVTALEANGGVIMLIEPERPEELVTKVSFALDQKPIAPEKVKVGQGIIGLVAKDARPMTASHLKSALQKAPGTKQVQQLQIEDIFKSLLCTPLLYKDEVIGTMVIYDKKQGRPFTDDDLALLTNISAQCAIAIANYRLNQDVEQTYLETIRALAMAVEAKDAYSKGHLERVAEYVTKVGEKFGLDENSIKVLRDGAYLHDLGKIGIRDGVLLKAGPLTKEEFEEIKRHPVIGESIMKPVRSLAGLCELVRHHQERLDGSGYPDGLKGQQIPLTARILAVADVFDALTTERPYRKALTHEEAKDLLKKEADIKFDKKVIDIFLESV